MDNETVVVLARMQNELELLSDRDAMRRGAAGWWVKVGRLDNTWTITDTLSEAADMLRKCHPTTYTMNEDTQLQESDPDLTEFVVERLEGKIAWLEGPRPDVTGWYRTGGTSGFHHDFLGTTQDDAIETLRRQRFRRAAMEERRWTTTN